MSDQHAERTEHAIEAYVGFWSAVAKRCYRVPFGFVPFALLLSVPAAAPIVIGSSIELGVPPWELIHYPNHHNSEALDVFVTIWAIAHLAIGMSIVENVPREGSDAC